MTAYCVAADLLLGDMTLGDGVDKDSYVNEAFDEINSRLGYLYTIPLEEQNGGPGISPASLLVLKIINLKLASGRLIMAIGMGGEDGALNAYGLSLVQEAWAELALILNGQLPIIGAEPAAGQVVGESGPQTKNADKTSAVDSFETKFFGYHLPWPRWPYHTGIWKPGQ